MIVKATFTSVWDGGFHITTDCMVNKETKEVFHIEISPDTADYVNELDEEYITINGIDYSVCEQELAEDGGYWYC